MRNSEEHQTGNSAIGKVVFDYTLNQFAVLLDVYRETGNPANVWLYVLEYSDGKKRERFYSEIDINPKHHCIVIG